MPTFDFANVVRSVLRVGLKLVANPFALFTTLVLAFGVFTSALSTFIFTDLQFISGVNFDSFFLTDGSGLMNLFLYLLCFDTLQTVMNAIITIINGLISFLPGAFGGFLTALVIFKASMAARNSMKDVIG